WASAFEQDINRLLALNVTAQPPSFATWLQSGGTAGFPIQDPGMTANEQTKLGLRGAGGMPIPWLNRTTSSAATPLTREQLLFWGAQKFAKGHLQNPLARAYHLLQSKLPAKEAKGEGILAYQERKRSGVVPRAAGGPVVPGQKYLVGEHGPEILEMFPG